MEIKELIEKGLAEVSEQIETMEAKHQEELKNIGTSHSETETALKALTEKADGLKSRLDEFEMKGNRLDGHKSFKSELKDELDAQAPKIKSLINEGRSFSFDLKNDPMTTGNTYTGEVIPADQLPGVYFDPERPTHVRQFLTQSTTTSNSIRYVQETSYTDATAPTAEGLQKPNSSFQLATADAPVRTIANYVRVSKQMLDDTAFLTSYLNQKLPKKLLIEEDAQVLYGDNTGENLQGIDGVAQAFSAITGLSLVSRFDALVNSISQVRTDNGEYQATGIMVNPEDFYIMITEKDNENRYYFPESVRFGGQPPRVAGVPLILNTAVTKGDFFVGDWVSGATMATRQGVRLQFFEQDQDNVVKNLVTVRIEERIALPIHNPNAFVYGDFASAIPAP